MKKVRCYIPNVLLTFLLVFMILAAELAMFARTQVLNKEHFRTVAEQEQLADKAYLSLESYFKTRSNSTGIPAEVFMDVMDREELHEAILSSVSQAFDYINGKTDTYEFTMDFTQLRASINGFFEKYAAENGYQKDEAYEKKVASVIKNAESQILFVADTFKFSTMHSKGWLKTAKTYVSYLNLASTACIVAVVFVILLLILCNLKQIGHMFYWTGLSSLIASLLMLTPCVYIKVTDYFAGFAIKDPQIFAAVVGFLNFQTNRLMVFAIITLVVAVVFLAAFAFICGLRWEDEEVDEKFAEEKALTEKRRAEAAKNAEAAATAEPVKEESTENAEESTEPAEESTENAEESTENVEEPAEPAEESTENVEEPAEPAEESTENVEESTEDVEEPAENAEKTEKE